MSVGTVLWDADGVVQRVPNGWEESMRPAIGGRVDDVEGFLAEAYVAERPALAGEVQWLDVLPDLLARWEIADAFDEVVAVWLSIEEVPGVPDLVRALRASGVACCLATNQDVHRATYMRERMGYDDLFDASFYSYELGVAKPETPYFTEILDHLRAEPADVLFIDDNARNVHAARSVGLEAEVWSHHEDLSLLRGHLARRGLQV